MNQNIREIRMKDNLIVEAVFFNGIVKVFDGECGPLLKQPL